jgi:hypothetical protein
MRLLGARNWRKEAQRIEEEERKREEKSFILAASSFTGSEAVLSYPCDQTPHSSEREYNICIDCVSGVLLESSVSQSKERRPRL